MDTALRALREQNIPNLNSARDRRQNYRNYPLNKSSSFFHEEMVDITTKDINGRNYYNRTDNPPYYQSIPGSLTGLYLRSSVAERLSKVDKKLQNFGLRVFVHDALRPIEVQKYFHDIWMPARVKERNPLFDSQQILEETEKYWAAPTVRANSPSPHATGAALDLTLCHAESGDPLYMGSIFDDVSVLAHTDFFEINGEAKRYSDEEARANRRVLYWIMVDVGFANNPNEWWHFSWGDQMWAKLIGEEAAHYGLAPSPAG